MVNKGIKVYLKKIGVKQWELADAINMTEGKLSRKMRYQLPEDEETYYIEVAKQIADKKKEAV